MKDHFLRRFQVEGLNLEKLLRLAAEREMDLLQVRRSGRRMTCLVAEKRLPELEELAAQGGWALRLGGYAGLSRWRERLKARWVVCALVLLALGGVLLSMQMIWAVELIDAGTYAGDVRAFLEETGRPALYMEIPGGYGSAEGGAGNGAIPRWPGWRWAGAARFCRCVW